MHREVKGAHILLTDDGEVKLGKLCFNSMVINDYQWLSMVINGYQLYSSKIRRFIWLAVT